MALRVFRSLWGCEAQVPALRGAQCVADKLAILKGLGYNGVEASLPDIGATTQQRNDFGHALREQEMGLILGLYSSWQDYEDWSDLHAPVATQASRMRSQLEETAELELQGVLVHINAHSGADSWSEQQSLDYFTEVAPHTEGPHGVTVSHESHRGRALANPFVAHRLCEQLPELQLTLDASHWMVVCERLLGTGNEYEAQVLQELCGRVAHMHCRIGSPQAPQLATIPDEHSPSFYSEAAFTHYQLWQAVWQQRAAAGQQVFSVTPEYGPSPYTPMAPNTLEALTDQWDINNTAAQRLRELFASTKLNQA